MVAAVPAFLLQDDDGTRLVHYCGELLVVVLPGFTSALALYCPAAAASATGSSADPLLRQAVYTYLNDGRTCPGTARRATSTDMIGAFPFRKETIRTSSTY